jgi:CRP-like cAMP-binding protein
MTIGIFRHAEEFETYAAGETIFQAGDACSDMYVVQEGEVEIVVNGKVVETVGPDGIFGEMALVDTSPRSATAVAKTALRVVPLNEQKFMSHVLRTPFFALQVMRVLAHRLRAMNKQL